MSASIQQLCARACPTHLADDTYDLAFGCRRRFPQPQPAPRSRTTPNDELAPLPPPCRTVPPWIYRTGRRAPLAVEDVHLVLEQAVFCVSVVALVRPVVA